MADNFNITGAPLSEVEEAGGLEPNNPAMTYVDFANQIARNSQAQQYQQALIDQAKLALSQKQAAAAKGINPEMKDYLPVDEAIAELKAAGLDDDTIQEFVSSLGNQQVVSRQSLDTVIRKKQLAQRSGQPFIATDQDVKDGKVDEAGKPLIAGQSYQAFVDPNTGETQYIRAGGEAAAGAAGKLSVKESEAEEKQWQKLGQQMDVFTKGTRGQMIMNTVMRSKQGLALIHKFGNNPPTPVLNQLQADIASIMNGGVATLESLKSAGYPNILADLNRKLGYYTGNQTIASTIWGKFSGGITPLNQIISDITQTFTELLNTVGETVKAQLQGEKGAYRTLIEGDPERFDQMVEQHMGVVGAGLPSGLEGLTSTIPVGTPAAGAAAPAPAAEPAAGGQPNIDALAAALGLKKKAQ